MTATNAQPKSSAPQKFVLSSFADFWLMGGASILAWCGVLVAYYWRFENEGLHTRLQQIPYAFGLLALVGNYPHFVSSYKTAYSRGIGFTLRNWIPLLLVPVILLVAYGFAYFLHDVEIDGRLIWRVNSLIERSGVEFRFGASERLGPEIIGLSIWLMYFTVGWHYSKQVFGVVLIKAKFEGYPFSANQRKVLKAGLFSIATYQFMYAAQAMAETASGNIIRDSRFPAIALSPLLLPPWFRIAGLAFVAIGALSFAGFVLWANWKRYRKVPSAGMLMPLVAFYVWWVPLASIPEFYFVMVPFFHSLQYLPFAYKVESVSSAKRNSPDLSLSLNIIGILIAGVLFFELLPSAMDKGLGTAFTTTQWMFSVMFPVFLNIHHFFIDSVIWKFQDPEIKKTFF